MSCLVRQKLRQSAVTAARTIVEELAYLNAAGWTVLVNEHDYFVFKKDFYYPAGNEFRVTVSESGTEDSVTLQIQVYDDVVTWDKRGDFAPILEQDGMEELERIGDLVLEVLN
ncbi:MAG TPA: hypothetical protein GXZ96_07825 [Firmicutes bacterium]|jgi:hypothetical protein|nr:hypothetical protein [Bacillota bacterium]